MHVGDTIFIFCLALIIFGPKKLPEIGRQIGKLMVEFRRASNDFKMQIEEELRASDQAERQKEISAAASAVPAALPESAAVAVEANTSYPVIAPPATGLPVNHTFSDREIAAASETAVASETAASDFATTPVEPPCTYTYVDPYETLNTAEVSATSLDAPTVDTGAFNEGLNTPSNGVIAELPEDELALPDPIMVQSPEVTTEVSVPEIVPEAEKAQATLHHG